MPPGEDASRVAGWSARTRRSFAAFVLQRIGPVEFLADVVVTLYTRMLRIGQLVADGVGPRSGTAEVPSN